MHSLLFSLNQYPLKTYIAPRNFGESLVAKIFNSNGCLMAEIDMDNLDISIFDYIHQKDFLIFTDRVVKHCGL